MITTFPDADIICKAMNAHIVALESQEEYDAFMKFNTFPQVWLYATDKMEEGL